MTLAHGLIGLALATLLASAPNASFAAETGVESQAAARDVVFLAEERPIFLRLRVTTGDRSFESAWSDSVQMLHGWLDRDGDGTVSVKEADPGVLAALVRISTGAAAPAAGTTDAEAGTRVEPDRVPKNGEVSSEELSEALQPSLGPFRILLGRIASGRTDALFDHLDRDKDGQLTRSEMMAIAGSLRKLDLDDNAMISPDELEPFNSPGMAQAENAAERLALNTALPPVVERVAGESSLRLARLLMKKYDKGRGDLPGRPDGKLARAEFAVDEPSFTAADANADDELSVEELRRFLSDVPADLVLEVAFAAQGSGRATVRVGGAGDVPKGTQIRQLPDGDVEFAVGRVRLDVHVDDGAAAAENAQRIVMRRFQAADMNKDGYLEGKELAAENAQAAPLAGLTSAIDRDGDGKLYAKELMDFVDLQTKVTQGRLVLAASDQGRAIFGILDLDHDRRLSAREVKRTLDRILSWDSDSDGRVAADEIPYHFLVTISRGELTGLTGSGTGFGAASSAAVSGTMAAPRSAGSPTNGPDWFRLMDRNRDGDVSHREFLGPRAQFDRLDRDRDGLIDAEEAGMATTPTSTPQPDSRP